MQLKFYARRDALVNVRPGDTTFHIGQRIPRINREYDPETRTYPAQPEPFVCDSESPVGQNALHAMRVGIKDPPLWPADEATAAACGVPFIAVRLVDGEWIADDSKAQPAPKPKTKTAPAE